MKPAAGLEPLVARLSGHPAVEAVVLIGSGGGRRHADRWSDVDLWICPREAVPDEWRAGMAADLADPAEPVNVADHRFGDSDDWVLRSTGQGLDLMFWSLDWLPDQLDKVLVRHEASIGHSTAWWRGIATAEPLFDRAGWWASLQERAQAPYPEPLRRRIVEWNHGFLRTHRYSFRHQLEVALARGDRVAVNHRTAAILSSAFDIVFAVDRVLHPGEKRLLEFVRAECPTVPPGFEPAVERVLAAPEDGVLAAVDQLVDVLDELVLTRISE